jgi:hypothetical protein
MSHFVSKEHLDSIQAAYDAGNLPDNKFRIQYNNDIIVGENQCSLLYGVFVDAAEAMEKNVETIMTNVYAINNVYDLLAYFNQEFGSRIILSSGAENL